MKGKAAVDDNVPNASKFHVYDSGVKTYDCSMNQTNIIGGNNNNKVHIIEKYIKT